MALISGGGGVTSAVVATSGKVLPVAAPSGVTVDTTTYNNTVTGSGKLTTLVFPAASDTAALAIAIASDAFPRWLLTNDATDGLYLSDGTSDPYAGDAMLQVNGGKMRIPQLSVSGGIATSSGRIPGNAVALSEVSPVGSVTSGALTTLQFVSGVAALINAARDSETHTPVTFSPGAATTATCKVELSPDDVTFSELVTITFPVGVVFAGSIRDVCVRVPAGWYLKLTVNAQASLGLSTYY